MLIGPDKHTPKLKNLFIIHILCQNPRNWFNRHVCSVVQPCSDPFAAKNLNLNLRMRGLSETVFMCTGTTIYTRKPCEKALIAAAIAYHGAMGE